MKCNKAPKYAFYPTLLDSFTRYLTTKLEDFFYQDELGSWHKNYNEQTGEFHYSQEEMDAMLLQDLLDTINKVEGEPSEAASKGTIFNEIVDCINARHGTVVKDWFIASAKNFPDFAKKVFGADIRSTVNGMAIVPDELAQYQATVARIGGKPFIYGSIDCFEFYFDAALCKAVANYFNGAMSQYYTSAEIETCYGTVRIYGWIDELIKNVVYDIKTTKSYEFGKYKDYWQRHVYPYCLTATGDVKDIKAFEFTVVKLKGGTPTSPLITGEMYREVYDYDHERSKQAIRQHCERFIEFLEAHRAQITDKKIFGGTNDGD